MSQQVDKERGRNLKRWSFSVPARVSSFISVFFFLTQVAVKFVSKKMQKKEQVAQEADVLLHVQNPQLVALLDTYESPSSLMLVLEL